MAIFSNYTKSDASEFYQEYIETNKREIQNVIDKINNFQNDINFNWEYDVQNRKFIMPDESNFINIFLKST